MTRDRWGNSDPRSVLVALISTICIARGVEYSPLAGPEVGARFPAGMQAIEPIVPLWVFGAAWAATGFAGLYIAIRRREGRLVMSAMVALYMTWGIGYFTAWTLSGLDSIDWVTSVHFTVTAAMAAALGRLTPRKRGGDG